MVNKDNTFNFCVDKHTNADFEFLMGKMETDNKVEVFEAIVNVVAQIVRMKGLGFLFRYLVARRKEDSLFD